MTDSLSIRLLGNFEVDLGGVTVEDSAWRLRKAKTLVKLLALTPERALHRERAIDTLWPEQDPASAANNLNQALYVARRALSSIGLDGQAVLPMRDGVILLSPDAPARIDAVVFEEAAATARARGDQGAYRSALDLYTGELLPGDAYEDWASARRLALRELRVALLIELAELHACDGNAGASIEALQRAVADDPLHESACRALMRAFAADGRPQQALEAYERLRADLRRAFEADPDSETRRLYRELLAGAGAGLGPAGPHNLPRVRTSFIGRERELGAVLARMDRGRLVTLTGAGGCGKTRLSLAAAAARVDRHRDGTWLIALASISDPRLVIQAVADAVGIQLPSGEPGADALAKGLRDRSALLIFDNCEHLVGECAVVVDRLLRECPALAVLATSREPLAVEGEIVWRVPSLGLPDRHPLASPADLLGFSSVRLFAERASDVDAGFELDDGNAAAVVEICHRLDGMPLALELAAARAAALPPGQLASRLTDALTVLTTASRSALTRRETLRATLEWSHDLLTADERVLFRRLAVFAGTFRLAAGEGICSGAGLDERDVAELLARLVDKSLVVVEQHGRENRYRLLEVIRQYAREQLSAAGEVLESESRHRAWYLALARRTDPRFAAGPAEEQSPERLEVEHDNLRAALGTALADDPEAAQELAASMWRFWLARGYFVEGGRWMEGALELGPSSGGVRARLLSGVCAMRVRSGDQRRTVELAEEAVAIHRGTGDGAATVEALNFAATLAWLRGEYARANALCADGLEAAGAIGSEAGAACLMHTRGLVEHAAGDDDAAQRCFEDAIDQLVRLETDLPPFMPATTIGLVVLAEGRFARPRMVFEETVMHFRRVGVDAAIGYTLADLASLLRMRGAHDDAEPLLDQALRRFQRLGDLDGVAFALNQLGCHARSVGELELARERLDEALALRSELGERRAVGMALGSLALLDSEAGDAPRARERLDDAVRDFEACDDLAGVAGMKLNLGAVELDDGRFDAAAEAFEAARDLWARQRLPRQACWASRSHADAESLLTAC